MTQTTTTSTYREPAPELRRRKIPAGEARGAVFKRTDPTTIEDLWDACINPECTSLEHQHVTTLDAHSIGGQRYDAIYCMGGGYYPACSRWIAICAARWRRTTTAPRCISTRRCGRRSSAAAP